MFILFKNETMKKNTHKSTIKMMLIILIVCCINSSAFSQSIYTNDMDYVLGDVKQRFITRQITTEAEADNLLIGFTTMKVNGIRIPIFPAGWDYDEVIMKYFFEQAKAQGFLIFANPAQDSGARRIASGSLLSGDLITTKNNPTATATVISTVSQFVLDYPGLKWVNPFNEDGQAGGNWTAAQMNAIYSGVKANMESYYSNGQIPNIPELIGPCVWGLPASIQVMNNTNIADYITVATSHNLGFNNGQWPTFIALADAEGLPVWDSEVNNSSNGGLSRIDTALANNVDGLVIYNSGNNIYKGTGELTALNEIYMSKYLKEEIIPDLGVNIAPNGTATQSSVGYAGATADKANDGNTNGALAANSLSIISGSDTPPYWEVDLGADKVIGYIRVYNRTDSCCKNRLENFTVYVIDSNGATTYSKTYTTYPDPFVTMEVNQTGQVVRIESNATDIALNIAEVEVYEQQQLSIEDNESIKIAMYPNPVADKLTVVTPNAEFNQYTIYTINGQVILSEKIENKASEIEINVSKFSKGIYLLKLEGVNFSGTYKVIKD